jgi:hypothetical protein
MTVVLSPPSASDTRSALADWMELVTLGSSRGRTTKAALTNVFDIEEDYAAEPASIDEESGETLDQAILEDERYQIITATFEELAYRAETLGAAYPFTVDARRLLLERVTDNPITRPGHVVYVFCLLASAIREKKLQPADQVANSERGIAHAFQICACLAAGGYINGEVTSFGFPRATGDGFLPALRQAFERFGIGQVRSEVPDGLPESLKDGGIDVIAWRDHPDKMPGKIYLLGQCASGQGWQGKSIVEYIDQLHGSWFTESPATFSLPAMFIPFIFHRDLNEDRRGPFLTAVKNRFWYDEKRFGIIFDRLRIAYFANCCITKAQAQAERIDGTERFEEVQSWVTEALHLAGLEAGL